MGDLEDITQKFIADVEEYVRNVQGAAGAAQEFAAANEEAKTAAKGLRDSAAEAALSQDELRNRLAETAAAAGIYRDETGKLRDAQDRVVSSSVLQGLALGHTRDEALAAAEAFKRLRDAEAEAVAVKDTGMLANFFGGAGGGGGIPMGSGLTSLPALLAIVPAIEALLPLVVGVASGFAAAGAGAVGFGVLAMPALKDVEGQYQKINAAQQKYQQAVALEKLDPTKAHAAAVKAALDQVNLVGQAYQKLPSQEQAAVDGIYRLRQEYQQMSAAFQPEAFKVFAGFLQLADKLLPDITPFAKTFADALSGLLGKASGFAGSSGFKDWLEQFHKLEGPSITAIGDGIGKVAVSVGKLLTAMSAKDVVNAINIAFTILAGTVNVVTYMLKRLMDNWDGMSVAARHVAYDVRQWADDTVKAFDVTRHTIASWGHDVASTFDGARHDIASWGHDIARAFDTARHDVAAAADGIRHDITAALDAVISFVQRNWRNILAWLVVPVLAAVYEIRTHTHQIAQAFDQLRHDVAAILDGWRHDAAAAFDGWRHDTAAILDGARHDISATFDRIRHDIAARVDAIPGEIRQQWDMIRHDAAAAGDALLHDVTSFFTSIWHNITSSSSSGSAQVQGFFQRLPGQVLGFLKGLPGDMLRIGQDIIQGLINGVEARASQLLGQVSSLAHSVVSFFTDPFHMGSPSRLMYEHGWNIVQGAINGVQANAPHLLAAMHGLGTGAASAGLGAAALGPAAGGTPVTHVTVPITLQGSAASAASPQYLQGLQAAVQEAVLRYDQVNATNGFTPAWGR